MDREVVKAESAVITLPDFDLEIPASTQKGTLNTIQGFISTTIEGLEFHQEERKKQQPEIAGKLELFLSKMRDVVEGKVLPFKFVLDDPSGNSFVENPFAPNDDPHMGTKQYRRTDEQNLALGLQLEKEKEMSVSEEEIERKAKELVKKLKERREGKKQEEEEAVEEVIEFEGICGGCHAEGKTRMKVTNIPYFKEVVLMSFTCELCGWKSNEVKAGGAIPEKGRKIILKVTDPSDMSRSLLKSETAVMSVPEIELELAPGTLGGKFTTIEGILLDVANQLKLNPFMRGDSGQDSQVGKLKKFVESLTKLSEGNTPFTIVLEDPLANSYIQNIFAPDEDPEMKIEDFERTREQNEELGLDLINTENY